MHVCKICQNGLRIRFYSIQISKFSWGSMPPDPPRMACFARWDALHALLSSLKLCTGLPDQCQIASDSPVYCYSSSLLLNALTYKHARGEPRSVDDKLVRNL